ncbi:cell division protein FtsW [Psychrosphaera sp. B3R10]|uniref:cell division protein FtsW n=1 Tax=unclassified Psychrosphaera TaxID=2641570 RepID=UPI001C092CF5|nr:MULTISPECIES: cell division protein FtsW [unclassified Psychrosphaera]MBU2880457.1 cell division protein FtsW [Psychrosphaera sp. I2R16]MBU2991442.1 cell division protein FtsW [Psychrosphaera sp. B3R10]
MSRIGFGLVSLTARNKEPEAMVEPMYDRHLLFLVLSLMCFGWVMVTSASMPVSEKLYVNEFYISIKHAVFIVIASVAMLAVMFFPMSWWKKYNMALLFVALVLLIAVLAVGSTVNGSRRWLPLGIFNLQAAEVAKLFFFSFLAGYLVRQHEQLRENVFGFAKPLVIFFVLAVLLLMQPDLGTVIVMFVTTVALLFLAGAKLWQFFALIGVGAFAVISLIILEPYRMRRVTSFLAPWDDPFGSGYQLTQSLMAYGRGNWFGLGLGNSIQKLDYLPEAHTDFIAAVIAEELGFIGLSIVVLVMGLLVLRILKIGQIAMEKEHHFEGFFAYAIGIWIAFQVFVNIGASAGMLPTKGLTLPFISYGGSSLIVFAVATAVVVRIDYELRIHERNSGSTEKGAANEV